jgi:hypothetical protein
LRPTLLAAVVAAFAAVVGSFAAQAGAATTATAAHSGGACVIAATQFTGHGKVRFVTATATICGATIVGRGVEIGAGAASTKLVNVGYGCHFKNFSKKGACWYFAVGKPGCKPGVAWVWNKLGVMLDKMKSWKAINTCHSGRIYSRQNFKGRFVTCSAVCRSLGKLNDRDVSLKVGYGKVP